MKTINPNSLVAIKPSVLSVGGRPSPGVYNCPCFGSAPISSCTPVSMIVPNYQFPIGQYIIDYQINDGEVMRWNFEPPTDWSSPNIHSRDLFSGLLESSFNQVGINEDASIVGGGGGLGAFRYYGGELRAAEAPQNSDGGELSEHAESNTITFFAVPDQENDDPIQTLFNTGSVTVHSCGVINWEGL